MPLLGAHLSVAGGHHKALLEAKSLGCTTVQLFTKAPSQWSARAIEPDQAKRFRETFRESGLALPLAHDGYLINLASPEETLYQRSIAAFIDECQRAELLGLSYLVMHPGAHLGGTVEEGLARVVRALDVVHERCPDLALQVLIETTAGQGTTLGHRFEHLAAILTQVQAPHRLGVCFDTCHVLAAGYGLSTGPEYEATIAEFERVVGLKHLRAFHLNDSLKPRGSRVDRHAHIGQGHVGVETFRLLLNDPRFQNLPMVLETPKEQGDNHRMDEVNLALLRSLVGASPTSAE
ncbi:MAG: deoxyribonuclease IV [Gemmataceae bacterium]